MEVSDVCIWVINNNKVRRMKTFVLVC